MDKNTKAVLANKLKEWLKDEGIKYFRHLLGLKGSVCPVLKLNPKKGMPYYNIHLWEGMKLRNFLRAQGECKKWNDHDFDNFYQEILIEAIK